MCIVTHADGAAELGLKPLARLVSWAVAGVPPEYAAAVMENTLALVATLTTTAAIVDVWSGGSET